MLVQQSQQRLWPGGAASLLVCITVLALLVLVIGGLSGLRSKRPALPSPSRPWRRGTP